MAPPGALYYGEFQGKTTRNGGHPDGATSQYRKQAPRARLQAGALRVRHSARNLTDGGGLVLVRALFDGFGLAGRIDCKTKGEKGFFRPGLMTEVWIVLLLYGGGVMTDLRLLDRRGVRRIFGWVRVPHSDDVRALAEEVGRDHGPAAGRGCCGGWCDSAGRWRAARRRS